MPGIPPIGLSKDFKTSEKTFWGPRASIEYMLKNVRGRAETITIGGLGGRLVQRGAFNYQDPHFRGSDWASDLNFSGEHNAENPIFSLSQGQGGFQVQRPLDEKKTQNLFVRYGFRESILNHLLIPELIPAEDRHVRLSTISSTYIRACVAAGDMEPAARALGRPHRVDGVVVRGDQRGRGLGYPTANVETPPFTAVPADGVYAGRLVLRDARTGVSGESFPAAISVGTNPTFQGSRRTVEAFLLDWEGDLYGDHVGVEFVSRLRGMEAFPDVEALVAAMAGDVQRTRALLGEHPPA